MAIEFPLIPGDEIVAPLERIVNSEMRQVEEEGAIPVLLDQPQGLVGETIGEVVAWGVLESVQLEGRMVAGVGPTLVPTGNLNIESVLQGAGRVLAKVPLPDVEGGVSMFFERFREGGFAKGKVLVDGGVFQFLKGEVSAAGQPVGEVQPGGRFARHDAGPGGRTDVAGGVGLGEADALFGEAVDLRGFVKRTAVAAQITPAEIVDEKQDDVGRTLRRVCRVCGKRGGGEQQYEGDGSLHGMACLAGAEGLQWRDGKLRQSLRGMKHDTGVRGTQESPCRQFFHYHPGRRQVLGRGSGAGE
jgi:hypothetical protein